MTKVKKLLVILMAVVLCCGVAAFATACGGESVYGSYYFYEDGALDKDNYLSLSGTTWKLVAEGEDSATGSFTIANGNITMYIDIEGEREIFGTGTVKNGVLNITSELAGGSVTLYKEGHEPSGTTPAPTPDTDPEPEPEPEPEAPTTSNDGTYYYYNFDRLATESMVVIDGTSVTVSTDAAYTLSIPSLTQEETLDGTLTMGNEGAFTMSFNYPITVSSGGAEATGNFELTINGTVENGCIEMTSAKLVTPIQQERTSGMFAIYYKEGSQPATPNTVPANLQGTYYHYANGVLSKEDYLNIVDGDSFTMFNRGIQSYAGDVLMHDGKIALFLQPSEGLKQVVLVCTVNDGAMELDNFTSKTYAYKEGSEPIPDYLGTYYYYVNQVYHDSYLTLESDGTWSMYFAFEGEGQTLEGTYTVDNGDLVIYLEDITQYLIGTVEEGCVNVYKELDTLTSLNYMVFYKEGYEPTTPIALPSGIEGTYTSDRDSSAQLVISGFEAKIYDDGEVAFECILSVYNDTIVIYVVNEGLYIAYMYLEYDADTSVIELKISMVNPQGTYTKTSDSTTAPTPSVVGTYYDFVNHELIKRNNISLNSDMTWQFIAEGEVFETGTYTVTNGSVTLNYSKGLFGTGTVKNGALSVTSSVAGGSRTLYKEGSEPNVLGTYKLYQISEPYKDIYVTLTRTNFEFHSEFFLYDLEEEVIVEYTLVGKDISAQIDDRYSIVGTVENGCLIFSIVDNSLKDGYFMCYMDGYAPTFSDSIPESVQGEYYHWDINELNMRNSFVITDSGYELKSGGVVGETGPLMKYGDVYVMFLNYRDYPYTPIDYDFYVPYYAIYISDGRIDIDMFSTDHFSYSFYKLGSEPEVSTSEPNA